ncbi:MAG TPA: dephospho-CoA kinase [Verrucomicrobiae bacterium]|jgi:dephospho-CoA kinase|nr:dephospho-CoA kinase [Verrucomicrobiae bacterium]
MKVYGLTGGIGMGKSVAATTLSERGIAVVDTDLIARQIVEPGEPALGEIQAAFGQELVGADGRLRRDELARRVFGDNAARKRLEEILHPRIRTIWQAQVEAWCKENRPLAVVVIPLLYETAAENCFDAVICVACSAATQKQRLQNRGWDADQIKKRIASQWPVEKKMDRANFVVWTESSIEVHQAQLSRVIG